MSNPASRVRWGAVALAVAGLLLIAYPAVRPWHDETTVAGAAQSMSSVAWVAALFFAMVCFVLLPLGLLALRAAVESTRAESTALYATVIAWLGAGLVLPYYGAEDFGLHAIAGPHGQGVDLLAVVKAVRYQPVAITIFGIGLILLAVAGIVAAVAVWRSGVLPKAAGVLFGVAFALYLPQFFGTEAIRIGHGVVTLVGCLVLAFALWRAANGSRSARS